MGFWEPFLIGFVVGFMSLAIVSLIRYLFWRNL